MATSKFVSEVKLIPCSTSSVYDLLSDFRKLAKVFELAASNPEIQEKIAAQTKNKFDFKDKIEQWEANQDNCSFVIKGFGEAGLQIVERDQNKLLKLTGYGRSPFEFYFWIQLVEKSDFQTSIRITLHAELNAMMKMMLKKKLEKGINQLAEGMTQIPYQSLSNL